MKKALFICTALLLCMGGVFTSCKEKNGPQDNIELSVTPTEVTMAVEESLLFALENNDAADIKVKLTPVSQSYSLSSSDAGIVKVEGKHIVAVSKGNAVITVKAGSKTAEVKVSVSKDRAYDPTLFKGDIYVPKDFSAMKEAKLEIVAAMLSQKWQHKTFYPDDTKEIVSYQFSEKKEDVTFLGVAYHHSQSNKVNMIRAIGMFKEGTFGAMDKKEFFTNYGFPTVDSDIYKVGGKRAFRATDPTRKLEAFLILDQIEDNKTERLELRILELKEQ